jgi:cytochrome b pre-mRNA-processing protein 3
MVLGFLQRWSRRAEPPAAALANYRRVVERARQPLWYEAGAVADDVDGRFDMLALMLSLLVLRLERDEADAAARAMVSALVECFVADVDGSYREMGIGDLVIAKHMGRALEAWGGRLGAYRAALAGGAAREASLAEALARNLYRGRAVPAAALAVAGNAVRAEVERLAALPLAAILAGKA